MEKVKISKDGNSIEFVPSETMPVSPKKFRASPEVEAFYRFVYENDIRREAHQIIDKIMKFRKASKVTARKAKARPQ